MYISVDYAVIHNWGVGMGWWWYWKISMWGGGRSKINQKDCPKCPPPSIRPWEYHSLYFIPADCMQWLLQSNLHVYDKLNPNTCLMSTLPKTHKFQWYTTLDYLIRAIRTNNAQLQASTKCNNIIFDMH
jgi:hypothetical protein